jgi:hypothetical protein
MSLRAAQAFVLTHHRHHKPPRGQKFSLGVSDGQKLLGVAIVGRPSARAWDDGHTLEVIRTCTDGTMGANSFLYAKSWKAARALGYTRLVTYTQENESGASLRGAGWRVIGERKPRTGWNCAARSRDDHGVDNVRRLVWEA